MNLVRSPRAIALAAAATFTVTLAAACFDGGFLVGRVCVDDGDCGPSLQCFGGVCGDPESSEGVPAEVLWTEVLDSGNQLDDEGLAVATNSAGQAIVAGYVARQNAPTDYALHLFQADGTPARTTAPYIGESDLRLRGVTRAQDNGFYAVGESTPDTESHVFLVGVDQFGGAVNPTNHTDLDKASGAGIVMLEDGSLTITGAIEQGMDGLNVLFADYGPGGMPDRDAHLDVGDEKLDDYGHAIALLPDGGLAVVGTTTQNDATLDLWYGTFDADGDERWIEFHDEDRLDDEAFGVAVDSRGQLVVAGAVERSGEGQNIWIRKVDADGKRLWTVTHTSVGDHEDVARGVVVDSEDHAVVVGYVGAGNGEDADIWTRKLDGDDGSTIWSDVYEGSAGGDDKGFGVAVDDDDNVFATGSEERDDGNLDVWLRKFAAYRTE